MHSYRSVCLFDQGQSWATHTADRLSRQRTGWSIQLHSHKIPPAGVCRVVECWGRVHLRPRTQPPLALPISSQAHSTTASLRPLWMACPQTATYKSHSICPNSYKNHHLTLFKLRILFGLCFFLRLMMSKNMTAVTQSFENLHWSFECKINYIW